MSTRIQWTVETEAAFTDLKLALQSPPTLGLPDPERQFIQTVDERHGCMTSVLLQEHGGALRPVAYFSCKLDPVAAALPHCLRAIAAAEKAVVASRDLVGYSPLTLLVPHMVTAILHEQRTSHLSAARNLTKSLSEIRARVKAALPSPADQQLHPLHPGDYVVIKDFRRTRWNQKRWQGPFQILLVTQTEVAERATWIHASHCKKVPEPKEPVSRE
ncbi:hypothetical protein D4764_14G0004370 [Takifugu flavidus]|uniref:Reverse transcriptase/retrotransposon-derived protein RNase H-like domain-containing protein n=1 Tax=Takifugu flavidus TaxID=433684 RepID=A0A5C6P3M8_9TELE|nr:hypothetical protein D4764_14G0004370 [Takifugu flavidus]